MDAQMKAQFLLLSSSRKKARKTRFRSKQDSKTFGHEKGGNNAGRKDGGLWANEIVRLYFCPEEKEKKRGKRGGL